MGKTKEFLENFETRWGDSYIDRLREEIERDELEWYLSAERPHIEAREAWIRAAEELKTWGG